MKEDKNGGILCEICNERGATEIKGGVYEDEQKMWMVCKLCKTKIVDRRTYERRKMQ